MNDSSRSKPFDWKKAGMMVVVAIVVAYNVYNNYVAENQSAANGSSQGDVNLQSPDKIDLDLDGKTAKSTDIAKAAKRGGTGEKSNSKSSPYLSAGSRGSKVSPSGLIYTTTRHGEHRSDHVLRHAKDQPNRQGSHGVFVVESNDDVFRLIDEAYELIKKNSGQVKAEPEKDGKRAYVIDMKRKIGFKGGQSGKRAGHPKLSKIKLILADNRVITAYPY